MFTHANTPNGIKISFFFFFFLEKNGDDVYMYLSSAL